MPAARADDGLTTVASGMVLAAGEPGIGVGWPVAIV
jgi:hypothetical protein